jgi:hypothetical protein
MAFPKIRQTDSIGLGGPSSAWSVTRSRCDLMFSPIPRIGYLVLTDAALAAILRAVFAVFTILASVAWVRARAGRAE